MIPTPPKPGTGSPGGITNRYDGAGFAADGTPIAGDPRMRGQRAQQQGGNFSAYAPGQAQPQQNPYGSSTPYGGKPQAMGPQWNQGGTNQQQTRQQPFQQYMTQGSPYGVQRPQQPAPPKQYEGPTPSDAGVDFRDPRYRQPAAASPGPSQPGLPAGGGGGGVLLTPGLIDPNAGLVHYAGDGRPRFAPGQIDPNVANNPYANRPPPFQATTQNFDGTQSQMPNFQQRDAFISQINNQLGQMQGQSWQQPGMGAPQFNFPQMWGQAGQMAQQGFRNPFAASGGGSENQIRNLMAGDIRPEAIGQQGLMNGLPPGAILDSQPPMAGQPGSARRAGIQPSVTYAQPGGGWGHTPTAPQQGGSTGYGDRLANPDRIFTGDFRDRDGDRVDDRDQTGPGRPSGRQRTSEPAPVLRGAEDYPGPVSPGTAQPIPPQSQGTPPRSGAAPWGNADNFDSWWETRKDELLAKSREVRAAHPKRPDIWERADWALRQHQDNRNVMAAGARMQENPRDNAAKQAYSDVVRQDQMKRSAEMRAANAAKPPQAKSMDDFRREDGSYDYEGARREWQAKQNAQRREYMKQPVAKRNAIYGSDANRRAYEIWMR